MCVLAQPVDRNRNTFDSYIMTNDEEYTIQLVIIEHVCFNA